MAAQISVLDRYPDLLKSSVSCFSHKRDPFYKWTSLKILQLAMNMKPKDFYEYLVESAFISQANIKCKTCSSSLMVLHSNPSKADGCRWQCSNKVPVGKSVLNKVPCNGSRSARCNTWFYKSKLTCCEVLLFTYHWWYNTPMKFIQQEYGLSNSTCVKWSKFCREVAIDQVFEQSEKIGGPGIIVEIDESKFGKSIIFRYS
jgi:hypothetical protein